MVEFIALDEGANKLDCDYMLWIKDNKNNILTNIIVTEKEKKMFEYMAFIKNINYRKN